MYGPNGISEDILFVFFKRDGIAKTSATKEEKNITKGRLAQPNQNPIAANNFASPRPIPYFFLITLYK